MFYSTVIHHITLVVVKVLCKCVHDEIINPVAGYTFTVTNGNSNLVISVAGIAADVQTGQRRRLQMRLFLYALRENRNITHETSMTMLAIMLYYRGFGPYSIQPVIAVRDRRNLSSVALYMFTDDRVVCVGGGEGRSLS